MFTHLIILFAYFNIYSAYYNVLISFIDFCYETKKNMLINTDKYKMIKFIKLIKITLYYFV